MASSFDISIDSGPITLGGSIGINVSWNGGSDDDGNAYSINFDDGSDETFDQASGDPTVGTPSSGQSTTTTINWTPDSIGTFTISVSVGNGDSGSQTIEVDSPPVVGTCDLSYPINAFTGQTVTLTFTGTNDTGDANIWRIVTDDEGAGGLFDNGSSGIILTDSFGGGTIKYRAPAYAKALEFNFTITNIDGSDNLTINDTIGAMIIKPNIL